MLYTLPILLLINFIIDHNYYLLFLLEYFNTKVFVTSTLSLSFQPTIYISPSSSSSSPSSSSPSSSLFSNHLVAIEQRTHLFSFNASYWKGKRYCNIILFCYLYFIVYTQGIDVARYIDSFFA